MLEDQSEMLEQLAREVAELRSTVEAQQNALLEAQITPQAMTSRVGAVDIPEQVAGVGAYAPTTVLGDGVVTETALADGAVTGGKIAAGAVEMPKLASGIVPPRVESSLPSLPDSAYPAGSIVLLTTDLCLYKTVDGSSWTKLVDAGDIIEGSITAGQIAAGAIGADELAATIILGSLIKTANTGYRVEIDTNGVRCIDSSNNLMVNIPTDGSPVYVYGQIQASSLNVLGDQTLHGTANSLAKGSVTTLENTVANPTAAPVLTQGWDTYTLPQAPLYALIYDPNGGVGGTTKVFWCRAWDSGLSKYVIQERLASDFSVNRTLNIFTDTSFGRLARLSSYLYVIRNGTSEPFITRYNVSNLAANASYIGVSCPNGTDFLWQGTIGSDGSYLYIADIDYDGTHKIQWNKYNGSLTKQGATITTDGPTWPFGDGSGLYAMCPGNADFGAWRMMMTGPEQEAALAWDSTGVRQPNDEFPIDGWGVSLNYGDAKGDGARFWSNPDIHILSLYAHTTWNWTTESSIYWPAYSWYDSVATTHETQCGPRASITMGKRKKLDVTCAPVPTGGGDDPDNHRLYMNRGATDPGLTNLKLQDTFATDSTTLRTFASGGAADPSSNTFGAGTPAELKSAGGEWSLKGDGTATFPIVGCKVRRTTDQSIADTTNTGVSFDTEDLDTGGFHEGVTHPDRITIPAGLDGWYVIGGTAIWENNASGLRECAIAVNGLTSQYFISAARQNASTANQLRQNINGLAYLIEGDIVRLEVHQTSGSTISLISETYMPAAWIVRLGP